MFRMLKLSPPHGWLAVVWELAIVTAGVLIALAAQQWVEERGWKARVALADQAIRQDLADAAFNARERLAINDCLVGKLDEIDALLLSPKRTFARPPYVSRYWSIVRLWPHDAWSTARTNDVVAHMSPELALNYATLFGQIDQIRSEEMLEQQHIAELGILPRFVGTMSDVTRDRLLGAAVLARRDNEMVVRDSSQILDNVRPLGIADQPGDPDVPCNSLHEPMPS